MKIILMASGTVKSSLTARVVNIGRELVRSGHEVFLIAPSCDKYTGYKRERFLDIYGVKVIHPLQFSSRWQLLNYLPYLPSAAWHALRQKADIVHVYKPTPITIVGLLCGARSRTKVILDMDDLGSEVMKREGNAWWKVWLVAQSEHFSAKHASAIMVVSTFLRTYYQMEYPKKPLLWVPNGASGMRVGTSKDAAPLVFIGSLNSLAILLPLMESLPDIIATLKPNKPILQIIGDGEKRSELLRIVEELEVADFVTFSSGWIDIDELHKYTHPGSLGFSCVPDEDAYRAASNQKVFNYLSMGIIPVVNGVGDLPYYVDFGKCGYIVKNSLAATLIDALRDEQGRIKRIKAGADYLEQNFLWSIVNRKIEAFYMQQLVAQSLTK